MPKDTALDRYPVTMTPTIDVVPYGRNAKHHPEDQIAKIADSIRSFGFDQPIVTDKDGVIIKGHGRWMAAQSLGMTEVPVVQRPDLTPPEVRAARLADNRTAESAWDYTMLKVELGDLRASDFDLDLTGFDTGEVTALLDIKPLEVVFGDDEQGAPTDVDLEAEADAAPLANVRMVQLFLNDRTFPEFMTMVDCLGRKAGTSNPSDTVMEVLRAAFNELPDDERET